jgi:predicted small lipoprotein YifL
VQQIKWKTFIVIPAVISLMASGLSGCGRRGPLEGYNEKNDPQATASDPSITSNQSNSKAAKSLDGTKAAPPTSLGPKKPFPLDPIL